jgi:uncharacterized protein
MIILLHSSKTMRSPNGDGRRLRLPALLDRAARLAEYLKTLSPPRLEKIMELSPALAEKTHALLQAWTPGPDGLAPALDSFSGDIYSGLQVSELTRAERGYADETLFILSGLYGALRPEDGICPYRLEMGYRLPDPPFRSLPKFWSDSIAACLPSAGPVVNLAAAEYSQTVTRYLDPARLVTPKFLTLSPKTGQPAFVVVHAKIARGAYARWLLQERIRRVEELAGFSLIGYRPAPELSSPSEPVFVAEEFQGKGLSVRLK